MRNQSIIIIVLVLILISNLALSESKTSHRFVDKNIAGVVAGEDHEEKVVSYFGKGTHVQKGYAWCYFSEDENQFIIFELGPDKIIEGIILSREENSECQKTIIKDKKTLATGKGIRLGDPVEKIIKIYGEPAKKEIKDGILIFEYHTDYEKDPQVRLAYDAYLYFKDDKLIKLVIHDGE
jgi:hypothetical protein